MMKLIRDNIPDLLQANGQLINYAAIQNDELFNSLLREKFVEEVNEYLASGDSLEELADIQLVLNYLVASRREDFEAIYTQKLQTHGAFENRFIGFFEDNIQ